MREKNGDTFTLTFLVLQYKETHHPRTTSQYGKPGFALDKNFIVLVPSASSHVWYQTDARTDFFYRVRPKSNA